MTWRDEIVSIMSENRGHEMSLTDIYKRMEQSPLVANHHLEPWKCGGQPRYQCWIRSYLNNLKKDGIIEHVRRSVYLLR